MRGVPTEDECWSFLERSDAVEAPKGGIKKLSATLAQKATQAQRRASLEGLGDAIETSKYGAARHGVTRCKRTHRGPHNVMLCRLLEWRRLGSWKDGHRVAWHDFVSNDVSSCCVSAGGGRR